MDIRKVKKLIEMMEESDITEIEVKEGDDAVRISRGGCFPCADGPDGLVGNHAPLGLFRRQAF